MSAQEKTEKAKSIASTTRATQPVCSISVFSWPANSKNAVNGMVPPSESRSIAPTGNLAYAQNAVKQLWARRCLIVPSHYNTSYYDVLWVARVVHGAARKEKAFNTLDTEKRGDCGRLWSGDDRRLAMARFATPVFPLFSVFSVLKGLAFRARLFQSP